MKHGDNKSHGGKKSGLPEKPVHNVQGSVDFGKSNKGGKKK